MNKRRFGKSFPVLIVFAVFLLFGMQAYATVIPYTDRNSFSLNAEATKTLTFSTNDSGSPITNPAADKGFSVLTLSGVSFNNVRSYYNLMLYTYPDAAIRVDLPANVGAVGVDLSPFYSVAGTYEIVLSSGEIYHLPVNTTPWAPPTFFGVISDTPIEWVEYKLDNTYLILDNFTFGSVTIPVANAGQDQSRHTGSIVTLDGSGSSDPKGNYPLTYTWQITSKPAGSNAVLTAPDSVNPSLTLDMHGDYTIDLVVRNSLGMASVPDSILISTANAPPIADSGPDQSVSVIGTVVHLNGAQSYDLDGDPLLYEWTFVSKPEGSATLLSGANTATPAFTADVHGTYEIQLVVSDPWTSSAPDITVISFENIKPVANAGTGQSVMAGETVTLSGSNSFDANGDPLSYAWSLVTVPQESTAIIADPTVTVTTFVPDLPGTYVVQLITNDGFADSDPSMIQVQAVYTWTTAVEAVKNIADAIASLNDNDFRNVNMRKSLINKLNSVIANIEAADYDGALSQLGNDILSKTDGCSASGAPDKNDWITGCQSQVRVCPLVIRAIEIVSGLI